MSSTLIEQQTPIPEAGVVNKVSKRLSQFANYLTSAERVARDAGMVSSRGNFAGGSLMTVDAKSRVDGREVQ